jgi:hypothetical protein
MKKMLFTLSTATGFAMMMIVAWLAAPAPCYSCGNATAKACSVNLSGFTLRKGDPSREWWQAFKSDDHTMKAYLALSHNSGAGTAPFEYEIQVGGDWDPNKVGKGITPIKGSGMLGSPGASDANQVIEIVIPYTDSFEGDVVMTATVKSINPANPSANCNFSASASVTGNQTQISTKLRIDKDGPTAWPVLPTTCPVAGEKPTLTFGVRNYSSQSQTYNVSAIALNEGSQQQNEFFTINGQQGVFTANQQGANREIAIKTLTLGPWQTELVKLTCETFGYCVPGATNQVKLRVKSASGGNNAFESSATTGLIIRDPNTQCPSVEDWGTVMPPWLAGTLAGLTTLIGGYLSCTAFTYMFSLGGNDRGATWVADHCIWIWPLAIGAAVFAATYGYIF